MKKTLLMVMGVVTLLMGGCVRNISSSSYEASTVGSAGITYPCTVVSVRKVLVEEENLSGGTLAGGAAGMAIGQTIGQGSGQVLATVAGGLIGAAAGAAAQKSMSSQEGFEYTVKLENGEMRTIVQGADSPLVPGQAAYLIVYPTEGRAQARSRLIAR